MWLFCFLIKGDSEWTSHANWIFEWRFGENADCSGWTSHGPRLDARRYWRSHQASVSIYSIFIIQNTCKYVHASMLIGTMYTVVSSTKIKLMGVEWTTNE